MQVAITDFSFPNLEVEQSILEAAGFRLVSGQCKTPETLIPFVRDADAVITQFAPIKADVIAAMQKAKVIVRYGIGVDNVDLEAARQRGIPVCNVPDYCIDEVADHTLAFILGATRQVVANTTARNELAELTRVQCKGHDVIAKRINERLQDRIKVVSPQRPVRHHPLR